MLLFSQATRNEQLISIGAKGTDWTILFFPEIDEL